MKTNNVFRTIKLIWAYNRAYIPFKILILIINTTISYSMLFISKTIIDFLINDSSNIKEIISYVLVDLLLGILSLSLNYFQKQYFPKVNIKLNYHIQSLLISKIVTVDYSNFDNSGFYDEMERALKESSGLTKSVDTLLGLFSSSINTIIALTLSVKYSSLIPIILTTGILPYWILKNKLVKYSYDISKEETTIGRKSSAIRHLLTSKYYAHEVRSFHMIDFLMKKYASFTSERVELTVNSNKKKNSYSFWLSLLQKLIGTVTSIILVICVFKKTISVAEFTLLQSCVIKMQASLNSLTDCVLNLSEATMYLSNLFNFIDVADRAAVLRGSIKLVNAKAHKIRFENVSFKYPNSDRTVLKDISFTINPHEVVLMVGENGSGKTTLLMLLNCFYSEYSGRITIDDIDIKLLDPVSVWEETSVMFQSGNLLPLTLRENIMLDKSTDLNWNNYPWFCKLLNKMPNGLDTILLTYMYKNGIQPSGGETQQIKLMRTILKPMGGVLFWTSPRVQSMRKQSMKYWNR